MHCVSRGGSYLVNSCCDLQEDNQWRKESYQACWLSQVLETRPQYRLTLSETNNLRRESYKQQQVVHFMVERTPSQILMLGSNSGAMMKYQLPFLHTSKDPHYAKITLQSTIQPNIQGKESNRVVTRQIAQDISKPESFRASSLMASPGELSPHIQRRE
ncbi:telethonin [Parambassis ranga]|uniref:Telethonin n=1 Tax=Parambassis ranga TaxID=210632 RepID=A0A6P7K053_9TELE|nr:telethonin-like [Parambassis ranga]